MKADDLQNYYYDVTKQDRTKRVKITFQEPVGCLVSDNGGEMIQQCFHRQWPPAFGECRKSCLKKHAHKAVQTDRDGCEVKQMCQVDGAWKPLVQEFKVLE